MFIFPFGTMWDIFLYFYFFQNLPPSGRANRRKVFGSYFQGVLQAKFGWDRAGSLGAKPDHTNKQTYKQTPHSYSRFYYRLLHT